MPRSTTASTRCCADPRETAPRGGRSGHGRPPFVWNGRRCPRDTAGRGSGIHPWGVLSPRTWETAGRGARERHGAARSERIGCRGMADGFCIRTGRIARRAAAGSRTVCAGAGTGPVSGGGETAAEHREIREKFSKSRCQREKTWYTVDKNPIAITRTSFAPIAAERCMGCSFFSFCKQPTQQSNIINGNRSRFSPFHGPESQQSSGSDGRFPQNTTQPFRRKGEKR